MDPFTNFFWTLIALAFLMYLNARKERSVQRHTSPHTKLGLSVKKRAHILH